MGVTVGYGDESIASAGIVLSANAGQWTLHRDKEGAGDSAKVTLKSKSVSEKRLEELAGESAQNSHHFPSFAGQTWVLSDADEKDIGDEQIAATEIQTKFENNLRNFEVSSAILKARGTFQGVSVRPGDAVFHVDILWNWCALDGGEGSSGCTKVTTSDANSIYSVDLTMQVVSSALTTKSDLTYSLGGATLTLFKEYKTGATYGETLSMPDNFPKVTTPSKDITFRVVRQSDVRDFYRVPFLLQAPALSKNDSGAQAGGLGAMVFLAVMLCNRFM